MTSERVVLVAPNVGQSMGGEAIKIYQFFRQLHRDRPDVSLVAHARSRPELQDLPEASDVHFVEDDFWQRTFWKLKPLRFALGPCFHLKARRYILANWPAGRGTVLHYVCPISPVTLRFPPSGYRTVLGPLNGNIAFPPGFRQREGRRERLGSILHGLVQRLLRLFGEKRRFDAILVSGYERTRRSLRLAGATEDQMVDVMDAGVSEDLQRPPRIAHRAAKPRFICSGRFVSYKGIDLAIRAIAQSEPPITLDVFGDGPCGPAWRRLAGELGVADRVTFHGWCAHDELMRRLCDYQAYVFPTLAEANGIVMQEAMMAGLPVIAIRWGGPAGLADDESAIFIEPEGEAQVVDDLAKAMTRLATDPEFAESLSVRAREIAERNFTWQSIIAEWTAAYVAPSGSNRVG